ncbi:MAG TPA: PEGA domain-containing protein [Tepidisphaeraceae bacterium]|jgi:hypothetical protein
MQNVSITSIPDGADIKINGESKGRAPLVIPLERNKEHAIVATLGSQSTVRNINSELSPTGILDIVGTVLFLVPGIGLFTPGAWELDSTQVVLQVPQ